MISNLADTMFQYRGSIMFAVVLGMVSAFFYTRPNLVDETVVTVAAIVQPEVPVESPEGSPQSVANEVIPKERSIVLGAGYQPVHGEIISFHQIDAGSDVGKRIAALIHKTDTEEYYYATLPLEVRTMATAQALFPYVAGRYFDLLFMGTAANGTRLWKMLDADGVNIKPVLWEGL